MNETEQNEKLTCCARARDECDEEEEEEDQGRRERDENRRGRHEAVSHSGTGAVQHVLISG